MLPLAISPFLVRQTVCLTHSVAVYDTRTHVATSDAYEKPKANNLLPMPAITPLSKKVARGMSRFDKAYEW